MLYYTSILRFLSLIKLDKVLLKPKRFILVIASLHHLNQSCKNIIAQMALQNSMYRPSCKKLLPLYKVLTKFYQKTI